MYPPLPVGMTKFFALTHSGGSSPPKPAIARIAACITPISIPPAMIFLPAGLKLNLPFLSLMYSVSSNRFVPCTLALKNAYKAAIVEVLAPLRLKLTVMFLAMLADWSTEMLLSKPALNAAKRTAFSIASL